MWDNDDDDDNLHESRSHMAAKYTHNLGQAPITLEKLQESFADSLKQPKNPGQSSKKPQATSLGWLAQAGGGAGPTPAESAALGKSSQLATNVALGKSSQLANSAAGGGADPTPDQTLPGTPGTGDTSDNALPEQDSDKKDSGDESEKDSDDEADEDGLKPPDNPDPSDSSSDGKKFVGF